MIIQSRGTTGQSHASLLFQTNSLKLSWRHRRGNKTKTGMEKERKENETQRERWIFLIAPIKSQRRLFVWQNWILQQISVHHNNNPVIYEKRAISCGRVPDDCGQLAYCQLCTISREIWMRFSHLFVTASINGPNSFLTPTRALMENGITQP